MNLFCSYAKEITYLFYNFIAFPFILQVSRLSLLFLSDFMDFPPFPSSYLFVAVFVARESRHEYDRLDSILSNMLTDRR